MQKELVLRIHYYTRLCLEYSIKFHTHEMKEFKRFLSEINLVSDSMI